MQTLRKLPTHAPSTKARLSTSHPASRSPGGSDDVLDHTAARLAWPPARVKFRRNARAGSDYEQIRFGVPAAGLLVQVQLTVAFGWVVVTVKAVAVPVVLQTTPAEAVNPGNVLHAP